MAPDPEGGAVPWLVLERVDRDPEEPTSLVGTVSFGGHRLRIVLDFGRRHPGLIEYVDLPELLGMHEPSQRAVIATMARLAKGEPLRLPLDLTGEIRDAQPPFPLRSVDERARIRLDAAAAEVDLQVRRIERTGSEPQLIEADLVLDGKPVSVRVRLYTQPGAIPVMRRLAGPDPTELTPAQNRAIEQALLGTR